MNPSKMNKERMKEKKVYVCPVVEVLEADVNSSLLTISQNTKTTLQSMQENTVFNDSGLGARENDFSDFDEE